MRPELRDEMLRILGEFVTGEREILAPTFGPTSRLELEAIGLLTGVGALSEVGPKRYKVTIRGYDYYEELKGPRIYRFRKRWIPETLSWAKGVIIGLIVFVIGVLITAVLLAN